VEFLRHKESKLAVLDVRAYKDCSYQPTINKSNVESRVFDLNRSFLKNEKEGEREKNKSSLSPESKKKKVNDFLTRMKGQMDRSTNLREEQTRRKQEEEQAMLEQMKQSKFRASSIKYRSETKNEPEKLNLNIKTRQLKKSPSVNREVSLSRSQTDKNEQRTPRYAEVLLKSELDFGVNFEPGHCSDSKSPSKPEIPIAVRPKPANPYMAKKEADAGDKKSRSPKEGFAVNLDGKISLNFRLK
jgi:hypothetical protein